jgi:hypothetical protein
MRKIYEKKLTRTCWVRITHLSLKEIRDIQQLEFLDFEVCEVWSVEATSICATLRRFVDTFGLHQNYY